MKQIDVLLEKVSTEKYSALFFTPPLYKNAKSYMFLNPFRVLNISFSNYSSGILEAGLLLDKGYCAYAIYDYEAGYIFENIKASQADYIVIRYVFFKPEDVIEFDSDAVAYNFTPEAQGAYAIGNVRRAITAEKFHEDIHRIKGFIEEGDTYQVNYTEENTFDFSGSLPDLFKSMLFNQSAEYSCFINLDERIILSSSPELFFKLEHGVITVKPMKGTISRGFNAITDSNNFNALDSSEKNRAENVMIVDLMRNDLGKICEPGSIEVTKLFNVQKYELLYQMTSEIKGRLESGLSVARIFENIFPCGSITGAPKKRTMEIIRELESYERGVYTGSIGIILKDKCVFNVAIRTVELKKDEAHENGYSGRLCTGSGITWESDPVKEEHETILKAGFFFKQERYFKLFESILFENGDYFLINEHLRRLGNASEYFLFKFDENKIMEHLNSIKRDFDKSKKYKIKLCLDKYGDINSEITELNHVPKKYSIVISRKKTDSRDKFLYFKTTRRKLYDDEFKACAAFGLDEVIFTNDRDEVTEGSFTNIFIRLNGKWLTPSVDCGLLDGVYRQRFIKDHGATEAILSVDDVLNADEILLTNSVRKEIAAEVTSWRLSL